MPLPKRLSAVAALVLAFSHTAPLASQAMAQSDQTYAAAARLADEAISVATSLPPGFKRDAVLRSVSRNLRWFGQPEAGLRAARAMTDGGVTEIPPGARMGPPRYVPLREAMPSDNPCDAGLWRQQNGRDAATPKERDTWAQDCLLNRDFHWIGLPSVDEVRAAVQGLPDDDTKGAVLAMLIRSYRDRSTLQFVRDEVDRSGPKLPKSARTGLAKMLSHPAVLFRLGERDAAMVAARRIEAYAPRAELIRLLVVAGETEAAAEVFELLSRTPPEYEGCYQLFSSIGGLELMYLGRVSKPVPAIGAFLDRISTSAYFKRTCPEGVPADLDVGHLLAAGRLDAAIARARQAPDTPFLLIGTVFEVASEMLRSGDRDAARGLAMEAAAALPPFDPGDKIDPNDANRDWEEFTESGEPRPVPNFGENAGETELRFRVIQLLAATGATAEAEAVARQQLPGAMQAIALSAVVAGMAGIRSDGQTPRLSVIDKHDIE